MTGNDVIVIGPFIAAVVVALAVLVVDLIAPGRRGPALLTALGGLAIVAARLLAVMRGPGDEEPSSALTPESARG